MRILAIDTSLATGSIAACSDGTTVERHLPLAGAHARLVVTALREAAAELGWEVGMTELVAVVRGPGSFTGLRVGVAAAKGIAWACGARLIGVSGFETIAWTAAQATDLGDRPLEIAYDAGRGEVYAATATPARDAACGWQFGPARLRPAAEWLAALPPDIAIAGPGLAAVEASLPSRPDLVVVPASCWASGALAAAAVARRAEGRFDDPALLVPDYLRPSYAEDRG